MKSSTQQEIIKPFRYLSYIISLYSFFFLLPSILLRKMVYIPIFGIVPISLLFTGIYFMLLDVVTEVYGYHEGKRTLFAGLITYTVFVFTMEMVTHIPSPKNYHVIWSVVQDPNAFEYLFNNLYLVWFSVVICGLFANTLNLIILSKWKILTHGKYFWMRSIASSFFVAIIYSFMSNLFAFGLFINSSQILYFLKLMLVSLSAKLLTLIIFAYPSTLLCAFLKWKEGVDVYDYNVDYNPFRKESSAASAYNHLTANTHC
jgi:uncharacterized PurR-regulated membrane protein YhhQ (DUF165 family)